MPKFDIAAPPVAQRGTAFGLSTAPQTLVITQIRRDGATQARAGIDEATVVAYGEALAEGATFPPIIVFHDGNTYWLADGFHRVAAHQVQNKAVIAAEVRQGTRRDAVLFAVGANKTHGLQRSRTDVQRGIETLLRDQEWQQWNNSEIARRVGCSDKTVAAARERLSSEFPTIAEGPRLVERGGVTYEQAPPARRLPSPHFANAQVAAERLGASLSYVDGRYELLHDGVLFTAADFADVSRQFDALRQASTAALTELQARADTAGLNIWREGLGYQTANKTGAANYTRHATLEAALEFIDEAARARSAKPSILGAVARNHAADLPTPEGWHWLQTGPLLYQLATYDGWVTAKHATRIAAIEEAAKISAAPQRQPVPTVIPLPAIGTPTVLATIAELLKKASQWQPGCDEHLRLLSEADLLVTLLPADEQRGILAQITDERSAIGAYQDTNEDEGDSPVERCLQGIERALSDGEPVQAQAFLFELLVIVFTVEDASELHRELRSLPHTASGPCFPQLAALGRALPAVRIAIDGDDD